MATGKAGWAEAETTPPLGLPMGGRGPRFTPGASVLDPLMSFATLLEDGQDNRTLWISVDVVSMDQTATYRLRQDLAGIVNVPFEAIVINCSHTHSGPMCGYEGYSTLRPKPKELQAYESDVHRKILKMAVEAQDQLQPVDIKLYRGESDIGINRRRRQASGDMGMGPNPGGTCNPDLWILEAKAAAGETAIIFNYGCHPVLVYGYAWDGISPDWPGVCRAKLKEELGEDTHAQFIQGLAGNVRPRVVADLEEGKFRKPTPDDPLSAGARLAGHIAGVLSGEGDSVDLDLKAAAGGFLGPKDQGKIPPLSHWQSLNPEGARDPLRSGSAASENELSRELGAYWTDRLESGIPPALSAPIEIGIIQLSYNHKIAWMAGEVLAEWMTHVRGWLNDPDLIVWGYCQDGRGYLPTEEMLHEGGYEVDRANTYSRTGPGPFAEGLNHAVRAEFERLGRGLGWGGVE
tara:strand:- start:969 stop:2351 length:1383 start_codon:yes stop_codon:yes gene_type:complete